MAGKHERSSLVGMTVATRDEGVTVYANTLDIVTISQSLDEEIKCLRGLGIIEGEHVILYPEEAEHWPIESATPPNCIVLPLCNVMLVSI